MAECGRVYAEININQLRNNILNIKAKIGKDRKLMAVIKADGYGHGALVCAKYINDIVDFYGVATADEAIDLITSFTDKPILVMGAIFEDKIPEAILKSLRMTVYDIDMARLISKYASLMKKKAYIHLKLDTGMSRLGFEIDENIEEVIETIHNLPNVELEGIFSHFATADAEDKTKTLEQKKLFDLALDRVKSLGIRIPLVHLSNSAATVDLPQAWYDMVRTGIIMYGYYPSNEVDKSAIKVSPVLELKSHIIATRWLKKGQSVSYNSTYTATKPTRIATIPVGYADGYPRSLSNLGYVIVRGSKAKILGMICMDQFVVDITDVEEATTYDEVVLIGRSDGESITLEELAKLSGKFNYEFMCGLSKRIPRLYFYNGKLVDEVNYFYTGRRI